jgi:Zn-dependent alcohol dehydrogenase
MTAPASPVSPTVEERVRRLAIQFVGCAEQCDLCEQDMKTSCLEFRAEWATAIREAVNGKLEEAKQPYTDKPCLSSFTAHVTICKRLDALKLPDNPSGGK